THILRPFPYTRPISRCSTHVTLAIRYSWLLNSSQTTPQIGYSFFVNFRRNLFPMDEAKFNRLNLNERSCVVWLYGRFVDSLIFNNYCLMLYSINRQFVELYLDLKSHTIVSVNLANEYDLSKYLDHITIEG